METVFTLSINAAGAYTYTLLKPSPEAVAVSPDFDTLSIPNKTTSFQVGLFASYDALGNGIGPQLGTVTFLVNDPATQGLTASQDGLGINNNLMNTGEIIKMAFDTPVSDATFAIGNFSGGQSPDVLRWTAYNEFGVQVDTGLINGSGTESANHSYKLSAIADGLDPGLQFSSITLEATVGAFKFTGFSIEKALTVNDTTYNFNTIAIDGDGDPDVHSAPIERRQSTNSRLGADSGDRRLDR